MFMFVICRRPSVCLSVCLSSVTFVHPTLMSTNCSQVTRLCCAISPANLRLSALSVVVLDVRRHGSTTNVALNGIVTDWCLAIHACSLTEWCLGRRVGSWEAGRSCRLTEFKQPMTAKQGHYERLLKTDKPVIKHFGEMMLFLNYWFFSGSTEA